MPVSFLMYETHFIQILTLQNCYYLENVMHLNKIHLMPSRAADNSDNTCTLKIKSHIIDNLCVHHNSEPFKHIKHH